MVFHSGANETNSHKVLLLSVDFQVLYINLNITFGFKDLSKVYFFASNLTQDTFQKGGLQICLCLTSFFLLVFLNYSCIMHPYTPFPLNLPINASLLAYKTWSLFFINCCTFIWVYIYIHKYNLLCLYDVAQVYIFRTIWYWIINCASFLGKTIFLTLNIS